MAEAVVRLVFPEHIFPVKRSNGSFHRSSVNGWGTCQVRKFHVIEGSFLATYGIVNSRPSQKQEFYIRYREFCIFSYCWFYIV